MWGQPALKRPTHTRVYPNMRRVGMLVDMLVANYQLPVSASLITYCVRRSSQYDARSLCRIEISNGGGRGAVALRA